METDTTDKPNTPEPTCLLEVEISESRRRFVTMEVTLAMADRICEWTMKYNPTATKQQAAIDAVKSAKHQAAIDAVKSAKHQAAIDAVKSAKIIKEEIIHDSYEIGSVDFPNATMEAPNA